MDYPGFTVSDAGQAYEALESKSIRVAVDSLFQQAEAQLRTRTLSVLHTTAAQVALGGRIGIRRWDRTVF
eukprot:1274754-Pyramimonas_sp.AAC.1